MQRSSIQRLPAGAFAQAGVLPLWFANSWTRENITGNNFLGNGGTELNTTSNLYDLQFRNYDPVLGRMNQVDPMATKYASLTPYNYAFNDPVYFNDPGGADPYSTSAKDFYEDSQEEMYGALWRDRMRDLGRVGDDDLFGKEGVGSGHGSIGHQGFEAAHIKARETGGKVRYSAGEYWTEIQIEEFVVDPLYTGFAPGVMAFKKSGQKQTQGVDPWGGYRLEITKESIILHAIMNSAISSVDATFSFGKKGKLNSATYKVSEIRDGIKISYTIINNTIASPLGRVMQKELEQGYFPFYDKHNYIKNLEGAYGIGKFADENHYFDLAKIFMNSSSYSHLSKDFTPSKFNMIRYDLYVKELGQ